MKRFGLIGHPIGHSLSPALFKAGYDGRYPYELIETPDFDEAYRRFVKEYDGINVTAPFKELAFSRADILSEECKVIKATNLLVKTPEGIKAYNSDYLGIRLWLQNLLQDLKARFSPPCMSKDDSSEGKKYPKVLVAGLGGAGKAAAAAAASLGLDIILMNRDTTKSEAVAESIKSTATAVSVLPLGDFRSAFRDAGIVIYNIPTAINSLHELDYEDFTPGQRKVIMEANYKDPSFDADLIRKMKNADPESEYVSGKTWLLYQAMTGYEIFTGEKPDLAKMSAVL